MLQVWQHILFIYIFYKFSFFSKNLFQQQKQFSNRFEIFFCCWNKFFVKKNVVQQKKNTWGHSKFFHEIATFWKTCCNFMKKSLVSPKALSWAHFNNEPRVQEKEQVKDQPHIDFCSLSNNSKYQLGAPDVTTVLPTWAYGRFKEIQSNFRRKKLHRTN